MLVDLDRSLTLALNGLHCPASDAFWLAMSSSKIWIPLYVAIIALMFWRLGWKKTLVLLLTVALCVGASDQLCNLVKNSVCRLRPSFDQGMLDAGLVVLQGSSARHQYGFFSAHAATTFSVATVTTIFMVNALRTLPKSKAWTIGTGFYIGFMYIWATAVSLSRVFLGKHFIGDITIGALAGSAIALILGFGALHVIKRFFKKQ